jgi:hypothetical protein
MPLPDNCQLSLRQGARFTCLRIQNAPKPVGATLVEPIKNSIELDVMSHMHAATNPTPHPKAKYLRIASIKVSGSILLEPNVVSSPA